MFIAEFFQKCCMSIGTDDLSKLEVAFDREKPEENKEQQLELARNKMATIALEGNPYQMALLELQSGSEKTPHFAEFDPNDPFKVEPVDSIQKQGETSKTTKASKPSALQNEVLDQFSNARSEKRETIKNIEALQGERLHRPQRSQRTLKLILNPSETQNKPHFNFPSKPSFEVNGNLNFILNEKEGEKVQNKACMLARFPSGEIPDILHNRNARRIEKHQSKSYLRVVEYDCQVKKDTMHNRKYRSIVSITKGLIRITKSQENRSNTTQLLRGKSLMYTVSARGLFKRSEKDSKIKSRPNTPKISKENFPEEIKTPSWSTTMNKSRVKRNRKQLDY